MKMPLLRLVVLALAFPLPSAYPYCSGGGGQGTGKLNRVLGHPVRNRFSRREKVQYFGFKPFGP